MAATTKPGYSNNRISNKAKLKQELQKDNPTECIQTNNNCNKKYQTDYLPSGGYDTLDSAYSTGESSYNTVDSSYTQSSGYSTLELKWKQPNTSHASQNNHRSKTRACRGDNTRLVSTTGGLQDIDLFNHNNQVNRLKFVDDPAGSDTETETETDTELTGSVSASNMSYVPDYIRSRPMPLVSMTTLTSTTASFTTSRPVITSTNTSPSVSLTSSSKASPAGSIKDEGILPKATAYSRSERNVSYAGCRENYAKKQQEKLCGRKSLAERLKSLETGASVKLQVCKGSQNRRRKSTDRAEVQDMRSWEKQALSSRSRSLSPNQILKEFGDEDTKANDLESKPPPPDIIESHQPLSRHPQVMRSDDDAACREKIENKNLKENLVTHRSEASSSEDADYCLTTSTDPRLNSPNEESAAEKRLHPVAIKWKIASPSSSRKTSLDLENKIEDKVTNDGSGRMGLVSSHDNGQLSPTSSQSGGRSAVSWKEPSRETLNKLQEPFQEIPPATSDQVFHYSSALPNEQTDQNSSLNAAIIDPPPQTKDSSIPSSVDTAVTNTVIPLRSPPPHVEGNDEVGRTNTREKRNARVFALPSSDDSENDNLLTRINKPVENKPVLVTPVKFVPSMLRRSHSKARRDDSLSLSSTSSSITAENKTLLAEENTAPVTTSIKPSLKPSTEPTRRKSSRSPKRATSKRSKSTHDRPHRERNRTRRGSHSPVTVGNSNSDSRLQQPCKVEEKISENIRDKAAKSPPHLRRKDEYNELTNVKKTTPRSHRKFNEPPALPSPRQQAVAHAVKFGFPGDDGVIPYIDEGGSPEKEEKINFNEMRNRASSDGALLYDADKETARRAPHSSRRGRSTKKNDVPRRTSYIEAMESSDDLAPDPNADNPMQIIVRTTSGRNHSIPLSKHGRSNSADSILSTSEPTNVIMRSHVRSNSADRNSVKGVHRQSYQIATGVSKSNNTALLRTSSHRRQPSIRRLKNFFVEGTPQIVEAQVDESRRGSRGRSLAPVPTLDLNDYDDSVVREGFVYFKVATIEKGKRTSSQKSWKLVWVVLKDQSLYLCKDWTRNKSQDGSTPGGGSGGNNLTVPLASQPPSQLPLEEEEPLGIQGSLVSIAYNYVKRKNVFKVTTCVGSEYLFQAEDRDDMLAWINSIQVSGNHDNKDGQVTVNEDLILRKTSQIESGPKPEKRATRKSRSPKPVRRMTIPVKDVDGSRRFKWRGSVNKIVRKFGQGQTMLQGGTFDIHLEDCPLSANYEFVPMVVELCCRVVEERGLSFTGIYRVPGNSGTLTSLQEELNALGPDAIDLENDTRFCELNVVSSLLKSFFRKLPDPLFTNELYEDFINMNRKTDQEERLNGLRGLVHMLPAPHYETLKFLAAHLRKVADNCAVNKMEVRNLAIVFGPTLVRTTASDNMTTMVTDMSDQCKIVESVLLHAEWYFSSDEAKESGAPIVPVPTEDHHEPVPNIDHLLANVGRIPGDASDSTSESSKSKTSVASERESFSRDVMDKIFGVGKRWLKQQQEGAKDDRNESSDDEFGFKEAQQRGNARATKDKNPSTPLITATTPPKSPVSTTVPQKYQVAKPAAPGIRAGWPAKRQHLPQDIPARLYDFYVENLERLSQAEASRPPPDNSTTSSGVFPQMTPRSSQFTSASVERSYPLQARRPSGAGLQSNGPTDPTQLHHTVPVATKPRLYGDSPRNKRYCKNPGEFRFNAVTNSTPLKNQKDKKNHHRSNNQSETISAASKGFHDHNESDSDTSVYVGDTLEEKLKNLTNLDKKLERKPSRRYDTHYPSVMAPPAPVKSTSKKLTAPSLEAGEVITVGNLHMYPSKKSTRELYQERKAKRLLYREVVKANRATRKQTNLSRCASEEVLVDHEDTKREIAHPLRSNDVIDQPSRRRSSKDKVKRRHTLGSNDFPEQEFWNDSVSVSMQDLPHEDVGSAMARLRPKLGSVDPIISSSRTRTRNGTGRYEKGRKAESYL